jgi:hypothetical protein
MHHMNAYSVELRKKIVQALSQGTTKSEEPLLALSG